MPRRKLTNLLSARLGRGFTLVEMLVALSIFGIISSSVFLMLRYQTSNWAVREDMDQMRLMSRGVVEEFSRTLRMAGGRLPPKTGGIKVWGSGNERVSLALNQTGWIDTVISPSAFQISDSTLRIPIHSLRGFSDQGYVLTTVRVPPLGSPAGTPPARDTLVQMPVRSLVAGLGSDTIVASASWAGSFWPWDGAVVVDTRTLIYNVDSVHFRMSGDTLFKRRNRGTEAPFAMGIRSLRLEYLHPNAGWSDTLANAVPANMVQKIRISAIMRTMRIDRKLLEQQPTTLGYRTMPLASEFQLRNANQLANL